MTPEPPRAWIKDILRTLECWRTKSDGVVISPDIDGLLSALIAKRMFGARIVGIYTTKDIILLDGASSDDALSALWLDLDIDDPRALCIGQHLIQIDCSTDKLTRRHPASFNPNVQFLQDYKRSFRGVRGLARDKYPFGATHLLISALDLNYPEPGTKGRAAFAHADGAWVNALKYGANVRRWRDLMFFDDQFVTTLTEGYIEEPRALEVHSALVSDLQAMGVAAGTSGDASRDSHVPTHWQAIQGNQSVRFPQNGYDAKRILMVQNGVAKVRAVARYLSSILDWEQILEPLVPTGLIRGRVGNRHPREIEALTLDMFLDRYDVFSHAIIFQHVLRYTDGIDFCNIEHII